MQKINGFKTINKNKMNKKEQVLAILENEVEELYYKVNGIDEDKLPAIAESIVNLLDLCDVSKSSYTLTEERIADFIEHWERIITPYSYENHEKRAIKTVIEQLRFLR